MMSAEEINGLTARLASAAAVARKCPGIYVTCHEPDLTAALDLIAWQRGRIAGLEQDQRDAEREARDAAAEARWTNDPELPRGSY